MDSIGGVVKQNVFMACLKENIVVQTAAEFCEVAKKKCPKVTIIYRPAGRHSV